VDDVIRPAIEAWSGGRTMVEAARLLAEEGLAAAPCSRPEDVVTDPHVALRNMLVEVERTDGVDQPVLVAGNPLKLSKMVEGPDRDVPLLGADTRSVLGDLLGLDGATLDALAADGIVQTADRTGIHP
jgi:crotonobetainyl-CoA:carnitine CoA-transferase CaiB-like acyl-CoA transferase